MKKIIYGKVAAIVLTVMLGLGLPVPSMASGNGEFYLNAFPFQDGITHIFYGESRALMDIAGNIITLPEPLVLVYNFCDGVAVAITMTNDIYEYVLIDKTCKIIKHLDNYDQVEDFHEGLAAVVKDSKFGYIDTTGTLIIQPQFDNAYQFSDGLAIVEQDGKFGYIDKTGAIVITSEYPYFGNFFEGLAWFRDSDGHYGYIDKTGAVIIEPIYESARDFSEGLAAVELDGYYGYIDTTGAVILPFIYQWYGSFNDDVAVIQMDRGPHFVIDKSGNVLFEVPQGLWINGSFNEGLALVNIWSDDVNDVLKFGYIDKTGFLVMPCEYSAAAPFSEGYAPVYKDGNWSALANPLTAPPSSWAKPQIDEAIEHGLVPQDLQQNCKGNMSRLGFCRLAVTFIEAVSGMDIGDFLDAYDGELIDKSFPDTDNNAVLAAAALGIVEGKGDGRFDPTGGIDRGSAAKMLSLTCAVLGVDITGAPGVGFPDKVSSWCREYVDFMCANGIMTGTGTGIFNQSGDFTTETSIVTFERMYQWMAQ